MDLLSFEEIKLNKNLLKVAWHSVSSTFQWQSDTCRDVFVHLIPSFFFFFFKGHTFIVSWLHCLIGCSSPSCVWTELACVFCSVAMDLLQACWIHLRTSWEHSEAFVQSFFKCFIKVSLSLLVVLHLKFNPSLFNLGRFCSFGYHSLLFRVGFFFFQRVKKHKQSNYPTYCKQPNLFVKEINYFLVLGALVLYRSPMSKQSRFLPDTTSDFVVAMSPYCQILAVIIGIMMNRYVRQDYTSQAQTEPDPSFNISL